jgi:hypothetical protein
MRANDCCGQVVPYVIIGNAHPELYEAESCSSGKGMAMYRLFRSRSALYQQLPLPEGTDPEAMISRSHASLRCVGRTGLRCRSNLVVR